MSQFTKRMKRRCFFLFLIIPGLLLLFSCWKLVLSPPTHLKARSGKASQNAQYDQESSKVGAITNVKLLTHRTGSSAVPTQQELSIVEATPAQGKDADGVVQKLILLWSSNGEIYWQNDFTNQLLLKECSTAKCLLTTDRSLAQKAHAIVFHWTQLRTGLKPPPIRYAWQRYVFFSFESASYYPASGQFDHFFNWTLSYRKDSTFWVPYGFILPNNSTGKQQPPQLDYASMLKIVQKKKKLAAIFASNCFTNSGREAYLKELQKYILVDVYGQCGSMRCMRNDEELPSACHRMVEQDYFFYLSFENSICKDYATEKLFKFLPLNVVPVVLSRVVAEGVAPPGSFIDIGDFESAEALASYLVYLSKNTTAYMEYFSWKLRFQAVPWHNWAYHVPEARDMGFCALCNRLHDSSWPHQTLPSLKEWWTDKAACHSIRRTT